MKQFYGASKSGNLKEAVRGIKEPKGLLLISNADQFERYVAELEELYPGVPSIGCIAMAYGSDMVEKGVAVVAFSENVMIKANAIEDASSMPVKYIERLEKDISALKPSREDTGVIDFCTGNDAVVLSSIRPLLYKNHIELMGGTGDAGKVSCNGKVYENSMVYLLIKNKGGKVKAYKENLYTPRENVRLVASKTDKSKYYVGELDGKPSKRVYMDLTGASEKDISTQTFQNPFGKMIGEDICIISIKEVSGNGLCCYRQVNDSDILTLLELRDINEIVQSTISKIKSDFKRISAIFSVNCAFRHILLSQRGMMNDYLAQMGELGDHCGFVGFGEHYNGQFINQTMTCVVFE